MRKAVSTLVAGGLVMILAGSVQSGSDKDARAIVDKGIQAAGGEAKLPKALVWKEKGTYYGMGDGLPFVGKYAVEWPDKFSMDIEGVFMMVVNGDQGWMKMGAVREMSKEEVALQRTNHRAGWIASLVPLKDKTFTLKSLGEAKVGDHAVRVVHVTRPEYPDVKLFFDTKTSMLVQSEFRTKAPELEFKDVTMTTTYSDYRDLDGAKLPYKVVMKRDGKLFVEAEITDMKVVGQADAKLFARPAD